MPEVPSVIGIVLSVVFMGISLLRCGGSVSARGFRPWGGVREGGRGRLIHGSAVSA
jgi:hypothetical protein